MDRLEISRRLKAARMLAGGVNEKGQPVPLGTRDLSLRPPLFENRVSANRIEEIEQCKVDARPMELDKLAEALGVPATWFFATSATAASEESVRRAADLLGPLLLAASQANHQAREQEPPGTVGPDRSGESTEVDDV